MTARNLARILKRIWQDRQFCLLLHIGAIDVDFFTSPRSPLSDGHCHAPHPLFDQAFYHHHFLQDSPGTNPFCHYLKAGFRAGNKPGPFFDPDVYQEHSDWHPGKGDPLSHYLDRGRFQGAQPGIFFDIEWYLDRTPVLQNIRAEVISHYRIHGAREGKSPIPVFDPHYYMSSLEDLSEQLAAQADPLSHYLLHSIAGDARPSAWFDPAYYRKTYRAELGAFSPLEHYLRQGIWQGNYTDSRVDELSDRFGRAVISVVVPVYNPEPSFLNNCVRSVLYQAYPHWELCLVDDGSTLAETRSLLEGWAKKDSRIQIAFLEKNQGIAAATNRALEMASGSYIGFLDNDDELTPDCLYHVAERFASSRAELVYTDEELVGDDGRRFSTFYKPDFNPELLQSHNYITHFVAADSRLIRQVGGLRSEFDGAQDFDLMLRLTEKADNISHIDRALYRWRATDTSTSINHDQKKYAHAAGKNALAESLTRQDIDASVEDTGINFFYRTKYQLSDRGRVAVMLWAGEDRVEPEQYRFLQEKTAYADNEFYLVSATSCLSISAKGAGQAECLCGNRTDELSAAAAPANKARVLHEAITACQADYIALIDLPVVDLDGAWLDELLGCMVKVDTGMVCGRVSYGGSDGTSFGVPDIGNHSPRYYFDFLNQASRHLNGLHCAQQVSCCGWDGCLFSRDQYLELNGFNYRSYPHLFAIIDLSFRMIDSGRRIIYSPYGCINRPADLNLGHTDNESTLLKSETQRFFEEWRVRLQEPDPFYNLAQLAEKDIEIEQFLAWRSGGFPARKP